MLYQRNRVYSIVIGKGNDALEIKDLQVSFSVDKTSSNKDKKNKASVKIYNLSREHQVFVEKQYTQIVLSVGYSDIGIVRLFSGSIFSVGTEKEGTDTVTEIVCDHLHEQLNGRTISKIIPAGKTIKNVIEELIKSIPEIKKSVFFGENIKKTVVDGYPLHGSPLQNLNSISKAYQIDWQIDDDVIFISDAGESYTNSPNSAYVISENSGMIDRPYFETKKIKDPTGATIETTGKDGKTKKTKVKIDEKSVRLKILLNPAIGAGGLIKIDYAEFTGFYKVTEIRHVGSYRGNDWYSEIRCDSKSLG